MGAPLKIAVGTSKFLLSITDTSAAWVYLNQGCVIPLMAIPSIIGLNARFLRGRAASGRGQAKFIRYMVIGVLLFPRQSPAQGAGHIGAGFPGEGRRYPSITSLKSTGAFHDDNEI
jgi:hypothetical protein